MLMCAGAVLQMQQGFMALDVDERFERGAGAGVALVDEALASKRSCTFSFL